LQFVHQTLNHPFLANPVAGLQALAVVPTGFVRVRAVNSMVEKMMEENSKAVSWMAEMMTVVKMTVVKMTVVKMKE